MTRSLKTIGNVVAIADQGFAVRLERYPSGRKLPQPRYLLDTSSGTPRCFAGRLAALDALAAYRADPRCARQHTDLPVAPVAAAEPVRAVLPARVPYVPAKRRKAAPAAPLPEVTKALPDRPALCINANKQAQRDETNRLVRLAQERSGNRRTTVCPEAEKPHSTRIRKARGGTLPGHLDPRTLCSDLSPEEFSTIARLDRIARSIQL